MSIADEKNCTEMPHSDAIEKAALTALAMGYGDVRELLPDFFYVPANRTAYEVIARQAAGKGFEKAAYCDTCFAVAAEFEGTYSEPRIKTLDILGAPCCEDGWQFYVDSLKQLAARRSVMRTAAALVGWANDGGGIMDANGARPLLELLQKCQRTVVTAAAMCGKGREKDEDGCAY